MIKNVCALLFLVVAVAVTSAATTNYNADQNNIKDGNQNKLVDQIITMAKGLIAKNKVEPIHLPDIHEDKIVGPMSFGVTMDLGRLVGLQSLNRAGDAHLTFKV